ncbi:unnamed protein product [Heligmosomoides polygyrus]|uniref:Nucleolar protein 14 n=1 Tax=Heligmosomoides polygyrus TaxID=6339 RepID=A0A183GNJ7_HELPZ|nr:unnamed protein product [Heligmosomoides polygyrus]
MGFASASREVKLKMMKTSNTRKTTRKLNRMAKKKKISRKVIDELKDIKARRSKDSRKRAVNDCTRMVNGGVKKTVPKDYSVFLFVDTNMGFASASREVKLKMMKTSNTRKTTRKLNRMAKKKKISRKVIDELKDIKARRSKDSRKRAVNVEDDWVADRETQFDEEAEDGLPLDMLDADIDWENSAFAGVKRRHDQKLMADVAEVNDIEMKKRKFDGHLDDRFQEMLPIKLKDGTILRPTREKQMECSDAESEQPMEEQEEEKPENEDFSSLSATELLAKRKELLADFKQTISTYAHQLLTDPQENVSGAMFFSETLALGEISDRPAYCSVYLCPWEKISNFE